MKVEAIKIGFYGDVLHEPGKKSARFVLKDPKHFSSKWMIQLPDDAEIGEAKPQYRSGDQAKSFVQVMRENGQPEPPAPKPEKGKAQKSTGDKEVI